MRAVREALANDDQDAVREIVGSLHEADQADLIELLGQDQRVQLLAAIRDDFRPNLLSYIDDELRPFIVEQLTPARVASAIIELDSDDAIDFLEELDVETQLAILEILPQRERETVEQSLAYGESSAGRLMQREFVAIPDYWLVGQAIDYLRSQSNLPDDFFEIYLVNPRFQPVGAIALSRILRSKRQTPLNQLQHQDLKTVSATTDQEDAALLFRQYGLVSAPVTGDTGRLIGVITVDDIVEVIQEEAEEDILALGGVQEGDILTPPLKTGLRRVPWLIVNLLTAVVASLVIARFEDQIAQAVALAVLMPIVASMGGNAGTQTLTVVVRALATRDVSTANAFRIFIKELLVGGLHAVVFFVVGILLAVFWFQQPLLALIFGAAMVINLLAAAIAGVTIPLVLDRLKVDPAVASGVFLTTVTDVVGFFAFLGLAALYLL
ncbi:MAG: magnesium transporter [Geminicoccaceae bacterium]